MIWACSKKVFYMPQLAVLQDGEGVRLDRYLRRRGFYFPQNLFEKWSRQGKLCIDAQKAKASTRLVVGNLITFPDDAVSMPPPETVTPPDLSIDEAKAILKPMIVFENDHLLVLNKPEHLATQGGTGQRTSIDDLLRNYSPQHRLRLTHRIDKETSGLLVIAKNIQAATELTNAFRHRTVLKTYVALCEGIFESTEGVIKSRLSKSQKSFEKVDSLSEHGKEAVTFYKVIEAVEQENVTLVELSPQTGRTHQLRVHMSELGHGIRGDKKYGGEPFHRLMLHAWKIRFSLFDQNYDFEAPLPKEFERIKSNQS